MRNEYDFSNARKNPYASKLKKPITIHLDEDSVIYFKTTSEEVGIPLERDGEKNILNWQIKLPSANSKVVTYPASLFFL